MPTYYHASPERFDRLVPRYSQKFGTRGIFLAPSRKSILESWGSYVLQHRTQSWRNAREQKLGGRETKRSEIKEPKGYQTLYLYKIHVPRDLVKTLHAMYSEKQKKALVEQGLGAYGAWGWDEEVFVPEEMINELRLEGCREMTAREFDTWAKAYERRRPEIKIPGLNK